MDYSVGSLADLISGKKTPNKTKVVRTNFTPIKKELDEPVVKNVKSPKTPKVKSPGKSPNVSSVEKFKKSPLKTKKKQGKLVIQNELENEVANSSHDLSYKADKSEKKARKSKDKKRKLELSDADDLADSNGEETTPKKQKLSQNDINAASRIKNKANQENKNSSEYKDRTLFVGNIPINLKKEKIKKHFRKYGLIDSVRVRGIPVADPKTPKKVAAIKKEFHPDRNTIYAFIRFQNSDDAKKAEAENGQLFFEHHLRVHCCESNDKPDESKAIFVGNLSFNAEEEELWNLFKPCGPISHVRIVRDGRTGMGKGFGYINFKDTDAVQLSLEMEKIMLKDRELRVSLCDASRAKKKKIGKKPRHKNRNFDSQYQENGDDADPKEKKFFKKNNTKGSFTGTKFNPKNRNTNFDYKDQENGDEAAPKEKKFFKKNDTKGAFTGTKFNDMKKKKKFSKATQDKKKLAKKLMSPKPERS